MISKFFSNTIVSLSLFYSENGSNLSEVTQLVGGWARNQSLDQLIPKLVIYHFPGPCHIFSLCPSYCEICTYILCLDTKIFLSQIFKTEPFLSPALYKALFYFGRCVSWGWLSEKNNDHSAYKVLGVGSEIYLNLNPGFTVFYLCGQDILVL